MKPFRTFPMPGNCRRAQGAGQADEIVLGETKDRGDQGSEKGVASRKKREPASQFCWPHPCWGSMGQEFFTRPQLYWSLLWVEFGWFEL